MRACQRQLRLSHAGVAGLDFVAVLTVAREMGADSGFVAELLPEIEILICWAHQSDRS